MKHSRLIFLLVVALVGMVGCSPEQSDQTTKPSLLGVTSTERTRAKISSADAQKRIAAVEGDKNIPESAKPGIIAGLKHDAGLQ